MPPITVETSRFGTLELEPERVIDFPAGLIGLGGRRYAIVSVDEASAFSWLQSLEDGDLALPITDPWTFFSDYAVELSDEDTERVAGAEGELAVWVVVRAVSDPTDCTANLRAPILVGEGRGWQVLNEAGDVPLRAPLFGVAEPQAA